MRRILLLMTAAMLMVAMLAVGAGPALAQLGEQGEARGLPEEACRAQAGEPGHPSGTRGSIAPVIYGGHEDPGFPTGPGFGMCVLVTPEFIVTPPG